jgi:RNA polymerase sigma-70 factor (ECF subfamily)
MNAEQLLAQARGGDLDAFAALFEPERRKVWAVACRLVGPSDAEDVVMDTFLKAWSALPGFGGRCRLGTWLCRLAHNQCVDHLRRRRFIAEPTDPPDARPEPADDRQAAPDEATIRLETAEAVNRALAALPEGHRAVALLRHVDGLSYQEIASALGLSIGTVMSRLFYARRKLRALLTVFDAGMDVSVPQDTEGALT